MYFLESFSLHQTIIYIQYAISTLGILIIVSGVVVAIAQYLVLVFKGKLIKDNAKTNDIRLNLGRVFLLGLEFIVAADLIATTTTPDYYALGLAGIIVLIRTLLSFSINKEIMSLSKR